MEAFDICLRLFSSLVSCRVMSCPVVYCPILSYLVLPCPALSCRVLPCRVLFSPFLSCFNTLVADIIIIAYVIQNFVWCNHVSQDAFYKKTQFPCFLNFSHTFGNLTFFVITDILFRRWVTFWRPTASEVGTYILVSPKKGDGGKGGIRKFEDKYDCQEISCVVRYFLFYQYMK